MKKRSLIANLILPFLFLVSCGNQTPTYEYVYEDNAPEIQNGSRPIEDDDPFANKGLYTDPELKIDGVIDQEYLSPSGSGKLEVFLGGNENTYVYLYKGERAIYFIFEAEDDDISTLNLEDINLCTAQSDSVELYVDTYGAGGTKRGNNTYEFRMTASGRVYSYLTGFVSKVFLNGTNNNHKDVDKSFAVEGYISYTVLGEDVNKNTPTSFAFARVTKTGNRGYVWHGKVDPQIPNNYQILYKDNKMYPLEQCPVDGRLKGQVTDIKGNPIKDVAVKANNITTFTNKNGEYLIELTHQTKDFSLSFEKEDYLSYQKSINKQDLRLASNNELIINQTFLKQSEKTYQTNVEGLVTSRDGKTPIENVTVSINNSSGKTNKDGIYSFLANCESYENSITFSKNDYISYQKELDFESININQTTSLDTIQLDESKGDTLSFGNNIVGFASARVVREATSFKIVLKTEQNMNPEDCPGSYFEVFIDTKNSACKDQRDSTDYRFDVECSSQGVINEHNYGSLPLNGSGIITKYGKINNLSFAEVDIDYSYLNISKNEVFGLYFGIKHSYDWAGMYINNEYIAAENPRNYYRFGTNSQFFSGSSNYDVSSTSWTNIDELGNYNSLSNSIKYQVSATRNENGVTIKLENTSDIDFINQSHSLNLYYDMNYSSTKASPNSTCGHISLYPGKPVSNTKPYLDSGREDTSKTLYEETSQLCWTIQYDKAIYIFLNYDLFGGNSTQTIAFALGCWNDSARDNDWLNYQNKQPDMSKPNTYIQIKPNGTLAI